MTCCNEPRCTRKKPMMLQQRPHTQDWCVVTDYIDEGNGYYRSMTRHALSEDASEQLNYVKRAAMAFEQLVAEGHERAIALAKEVVGEQS